MSQFGIETIHQGSIQESTQINNLNIFMCIIYLVCIIHVINLYILQKHALVSQRYVILVVPFANTV